MFTRGITLYEVDQKILEAIYLNLDEETGEITDLESLNKLEMERSDIIQNLVFQRKNLLGDVDAIESEIERLKDLKSKKAKTIEKIEGWLANSLDGTNYYPESGLFEINFRSSKSTEVYDFDALMEFDVTGKYLKVVKPEPSKSEIGKALKAGIDLPGCRIIEKKNMTIK